jgi:hypothetical protein
MVNNTATRAESDPRYHTDRIKQMLSKTADHCRDDINKIDDPRAKALFETTAEVLNGLTTAFTHYEEHSEPGWK